MIGLSLTRDGKTLIAAGTDGVIRVWDVASGQMRRTFTGHTNSVYQAVLSPNEKLLASASRDQTVRLWDVATGQERRQFAGFHCSVKSVAFSPNGKLLAAGGNDGVLKLWQVADGKELQSLVHATAPNADASVYAVVFSRDGQKVYAANGDGTISAWDTRTGKEASNWKAHQDTIISLAFSPDYRWLASNGYNEANVKIWETKTRRAVRTLGGKTAAHLVEQSHIVTFSPDGKLVAFSVTGFDGKQQQYVYVRTSVWQVETGMQRFVWEGQKFDVGGLVFTPDSRYLISGSADTTIRIYDVKNGQEVKTLVPPPVSQTK